MVGSRLLTFGAHITKPTHVKYVCTKTKRILGLLHHKNCYTPWHVEYAATAWSPHLQNGCIYALENVYKSLLLEWCIMSGMDYHDLIGLTTIPTLEERRKVMRLCVLYKMSLLDNICYFTPDAFTSSTCVCHTP